MSPSTQNPRPRQSGHNPTSRTTFPKKTVVLLLLTFLAIILPFCLFGEAINAWTESLIRQAYAHRLSTGALLALLLAVDIVMPIPSSLVSTACGMTLGFAGGSLASFTGMTLSAAAGYLLGRAASDPVRKMLGENELAVLRSFQQRHGAWMLLVLRPVPVLAEASVLFSGLSRQPLPGVMAATALGNLAVSATYSAIGTWGRTSDSFLPAFGASLLLSGALMLRSRRRPPASPAGPASE